MMNSAKKIILPVLKPLGCKMLLQKQGCDRFKNWISSSGDITLTKRKRNAFSSKSHPCSYLKAIRVQFDVCKRRNVFGTTYKSTDYEI
jgi:hypothetical protein